MVKNRNYHLTLATSEFRGHASIRSPIDEIFSPVSLSFMSIIVFEKSNFEKDQRAKRYLISSRVETFYFFLTQTSLRAPE